ncbi:MAPEG family protein [Thalassotalea aquiviva]|uniref:MAPEG family protein n=1 Tax=Thalassotalea aquiviva TaxID=3242415 RepID=UPI00352B3100
MSSYFLYPLVSMLLLTFVVWLYMYIRRLHYVFSHKIKAQQLHRPEQLTELIPEPINRSANNLKNLFELPIIFYALILTCFIFNWYDPLLLNFAWGFVMLRALHSIIHCTYNRVSHRFIVYMLSSICLWAMLLFVVSKVWSNG